MLIQIIHFTLVVTRKYQLRGYILGVLTHTTALDQLWRGDVVLKMYICSLASPRGPVVWLGSGLLELWPCGFRIEYTLSMFYKQRFNLITSWQISNFDSRCLFFTQNLEQLWLIFCPKVENSMIFASMWECNWKSSPLKQKVFFYLLFIRSSKIFKFKMLKSTFYLFSYEKYWC